MFRLYIHFVHTSILVQWQHSMVRNNKDSPNLEPHGWHRHVHHLGKANLETKTSGTNPAEHHYPSGLWAFRPLCYQRLRQWRDPYLGFGLPRARSSPDSWGGSVAYFFEAVFVSGICPQNRRTLYSIHFSKCYAGFPLQKQIE